MVATRTDTGTKPRIAGRKPVAHREQNSAYRPPCADLQDPPRGPGGSRHDHDGCMPDRPGSIYGVGEGRLVRLTLTTIRPTTVTNPIPTTSAINGTTGRSLTGVTVIGTTAVAVSVPSLTV